VNWSLGFRRAKMKAIHSGMAVAASPTLWMVSASRATLPEISTMKIWKTAVIARITKDHLIAQMPRSVVAIVGSMTPCVCAWPPSWLWP
jgi:hypothetical protein